MKAEEDKKTTLKFYNPVAMTFSTNDKLYVAQPVKNIVKCKELTLIFLKRLFYSHYT